MRLADYVMQRVAETGVRHVFMVPGGGAILAQYPSVRAAFASPARNIGTSGSTSSIIADRSQS